MIYTSQGVEDLNEGRVCTTELARVDAEVGSCDKKCRT